MVNKYIALIRPLFPRMAIARMNYYTADFTPAVIVQINITDSYVTAVVQDDYDFTDFLYSDTWRTPEEALKRLYEKALDYVSAEGV